MAIYRYLYGSMTTSGYGSLQDQFAWPHFVPNLERYFTWLVGSQTPFVLVGLAAVVAPWRRLWPYVRDRRFLVLSALFVVLMCVQYCGYLVFDDWLFLRFLLPIWPFLMLGMAGAVLAVARSRRPAAALAAGAAVIWLGVYDWRVSAWRGAFDTLRWHRQFVGVATVVREATGPDAIVYCMLHSGSLRFYAGRMTLRYNLLDADWLDRSVAWLDAHGAHAYAVLEDNELPEFREHFAGQARVSVLDRPVLVYRGVSNVWLFNLSSPPPAGSVPTVVQEIPPGQLRCLPPVPLSRPAFGR